MDDTPEVIDIYQRSQAATQIPDPLFYPAIELGKYLYARQAIERFVAIEAGRIVGHSMIEVANPNNMPIWRQGLGDDNDTPLVEFGGLFVDPRHARRGIGTALLSHSLNAARNLEAVPVSATWQQNEHVKRMFETQGGVEVGGIGTLAGEIRLFVFER